MCSMDPVESVVYRKNWWVAYPALARAQSSDWLIAFSTGHRSDLYDSLISSRYFQASMLLVPGPLGF